MSQDNPQQQSPVSPATPVQPAAGGGIAAPPAEATAATASEQHWWQPSHQKPTHLGAEAPTVRQPTTAQFDPAYQPNQQAPAGQAPQMNPPQSGQGQPNQGQPNQAWAQPAAYPTAAGGWRPPTSPRTGGTTVVDAKPKRRRTTLIAASTIAVALVAGFGGGYLASDLNTNSTPQSSALTSLSSAPTASANLAPAAAGSVEQVAAAVLPSVVSVLSSSSSSEGEGSGVILSADGLILTNNHVIDGATTLQVQFNDGTTATATVVGADSTDDLAVIKADGVSGLTPASIGSSAGLQVGQDVVAVGSPLGLSATVTSGIVSALNRPAATSDAQEQTPQQQLQQLTRDHSLLEELVARGHYTREDANRLVRKNIVTRALGVETEVLIDLIEDRLQPGDLLLLCSDGLTDMLDDERIAAILGIEADLPVIGRSLIDTALAAGGRDNVSVALARIDDARVAGVVAEPSWHGRLRSWFAGGAA